MTSVTLDQLLVSVRQRAVQACAQELARACGGAARADEWWAARGLDVADWHALAANTLVEVRHCARKGKQREPMSA